MSSVSNIINGYVLTQDFSNKNAGTCQWSFCIKGSREYFIKQFLSPKYPLDSAEISPKQKEKKRKIADRFYHERYDFYERLKKCRTGNIVIVEDFFRWESCYYSVSEKIDTDTVPISIIARQDDDKKITLMRSVLHSIRTLHENGIVHSDIKPDNIIIKATDMGFYTAKIIDFESSFLESAPPAVPSGDQIYFAPEALERINDEDNEKNITLSSKVDIFALGVLFHEYWTGRRPSINESEYNYIHEAVLDGSPVHIARSIPDNIRSILERMLAKDPRMRPTANDVLNELAGKPAAGETSFGSPAESSRKTVGAEETPYSDPTKPVSGSYRIKMNFPGKGKRSASAPPRREPAEPEIPEGFYISDDLG